MQFLALVFAHLLADYPLQGEFLAREKGNYPLLMVSHCGIWTGCIAVGAHLAGVNVSPMMLASLFVIHFAADMAKARRWTFYAHLRDPLGAALWIDQAIHMVQLIAVVVLD